MSAFFFAAGLTRAQVRPSRSPYEAKEMYQTWDTCATGIVYGGDMAQAQQMFEEFCRLSPEGEEPLETVIKRLVGAQIVERLLTESGGQPLDWPKIATEVTDEVSATPIDDFEQGFWVDMNQVMPPGKVSANMEALKLELPENVRSGLNWSPEKQFLFLVTVLSPPPAPVYVEDTFEEQDGNQLEDENEEKDEQKEPALEENIAALPEMRDKEAAAIVEARNSVVAAWLWRKFAADTPLAQNELQILPVCIPMQVVMKD